MKAISTKAISAALIVFMMSAALSGCGPNSKKLLEEKWGAAITAQAAEFAEYREFKVEVTPQIKPYQVKADLSNVENRDRFEFSPRRRLCWPKTALWSYRQCIRNFLWFMSLTAMTAFPT